MSSQMRSGLTRRLVAEAGGTACLMAAVMGSGTMAERLAPGAGAMSLIASSIAVGGALIAITLALQKLSGAHFNPALSLAAAIMRELSWRDATLYMLVQGAGAMVGTGAALLVFGEPLSSPSSILIDGLHLRRSELIATMGLVAVVCCCRPGSPSGLPYAVATYTVAATWFTASTAYANPAVTLALAALYPVAAIEWAGVVSTLVGQFAGAVIAAMVVVWLLAPHREVASGSVVSLGNDRADDAAIRQGAASTGSEVRSRFRGVMGA